MKKLTVTVIVLLLMGASYGFGTFNASKTISVPPAAWAQGSEAAHAWRQFVASLEAAGARVFSASKNQRDQLEGIHYLAQMATVSLEMKFAKGSVEAPAFTDWMSDYRKFLGDSPDAVYHTAEVSSKYDYEITGNVRDTEYLSFALYGVGLTGWNRAADNVSNQSIRFDDQGNFTLVLSKTKPADRDVDWLKLEDDIHIVMARQYDHNRSSKPGSTLSIRNLSSPKYSPMSDEDTATRLADATGFFNSTVDGAIALAKILSTGPNTIDPPKSYSADFGGIFYPTDDNVYYGSWFVLQEDEALIVEGAVPDAPYWGVSLQNRWMQSLDYEREQVSLNGAQIQSDGDRYRVIVSHRNPASGNWLNTTGHKEGLLSIRYQLPASSEKPSIRLVKFDSL